MFTVYVWVDGNAFDADAFQRTVGSRLGGTVVSRKQMRDGSVELREKSWKSPEIRVDSGYPEDQLQKLLMQMKPELAELAKVPGTRLIAEVVAYFDDPESVGGFFFSPEAIRLMAELGIGLDIDIYAWSGTSQ
jgi:uncharacterized protein DUF4279